jgi:hypothetical protein
MRIIGCMQNTHAVLNESIGSWDKNPIECNY